MLIPDLGGTDAVLEYGSNLSGAAEGVLFRLDLTGNDTGPAWIGGLNELAFLSSAVDDAYSSLSPPAPAQAETTQWDNAVEPKLASIPGVTMAEKLDFLLAQLSALESVRKAFVDVGYVVDTQEGLLRHVEAVIGGNMADRVDWDEARSIYQLAVEQVAQTKVLKDAVESLRDGLIADQAGNLCTLEGRVIATGEPDQAIWRSRIAAIVNAVAEEFNKMESEE